MSHVRGTETELERVVRSELHRNGFRFRKNVKELPGRPDIVLPKYKAVVFVHGCFWHGHKGCPAAKLPDANAGFWREKISANIERDRHQVTELRRLTWRVVILWGCAVQKDAEAALQELTSWLRSQDASATIG
jgi:DNA mismatch endonuclease (patch repair protein)